jgi:hypothetical protein
MGQCAGGAGGAMVVLVVLVVCGAGKGYPSAK